MAPPPPSTTPRPLSIRRDATPRQVPVTTRIPAAVLRTHLCLRRSPPDAVGTLPRVRCQARRCAKIPHRPKHTTRTTHTSSMSDPGPRPPPTTMRQRYGSRRSESEKRCQKCARQGSDMPSHHSQSHISVPNRIVHRPALHPAAACSSSKSQLTLAPHPRIPPRRNNLIGTPRSFGDSRSNPHGN